MMITSQLGLLSLFLTTSFTVVGGILSYIGLLAGGILSGGILSGGILSGGIMSGGILSSYVSIKCSKT